MPDRSVRPAWLGWLTMILASWSVCAALQYQPLEIYGNGEECALILDGPGRTNVFDYTYNLLRGSFRPSTGAQTCITYDAVNHAYIEARKRIKVARPKSEMWRPEDLATVGELLLDISRNLAQTYGLSAEEIEKSLPLIDTSKTLIREVCPAFLSNVECRPGKYRRYDGLCTNLQNPTWGATLSPFTRLLPPRFADSLTAPRISVTGHELPLSRVVSRTMHPDEGYHDHAGTVMVIAWGQFMDHDYTLTGTPLDPLNRNDPEECCNRPPHLRNPYCNEILIPEDDYFYRLFNIKCMDFVRAFPAVRPGCRLGSRVPFNLLTGVLDGNTVYGITEAFARKLRTGYGGLLRMNPVFQEYGLKDLLPLKLDIPDEGCTRPNRSMYCFEAGEIRVNEQLVLTCMHTLLAREHNRIAKTLTQVNPHWDDETLFQESRRIVIAEIQHITYNEFLPILLGKDVMEKFGLLLEKNGYWDGYDESVNPGVIDAFASAAFRFGHSLLPTAVERWSKAHKFIASKRLSDLIRRPYDLYRAGVLDEYFMGLMNQVAQAMDDSITQEVTNHLFKKVGAKFGMDLVSFNMQRGREFGIPSYMEFRKFCGLPGADTFDELFGSMPNETIRRYSSIFEHPSDVDLWSGGVSERPLPGSMLGPTFACIIATQFSYSRRGDRFWYELPNQPSSFTLDQLNEIRKTKLSKLICDNTDLIDTVQIYPMVLPDHEINPRVPCRSGVLPSMDLTKWAEFPTSSGHSAQYKAVVSPLRELLKTEGKRKLSKNKLKLERSKTKKGSTKIDKSSGSLLKRLLDLIESIVPIDRRTTINKTIVTNNIFLSGLDRDDNDNDKLRADEVAEKIRQKNKTGLDRRAEKIRSKRSKRSAKNGSTEDKNNNNSESGSDGFYRHPKLSYEDQKVRPERLESTTPREDDSGSSKEFRKRAWTTDSSNPRLKIIVAPEEHSRKTKPSEVIEDKKVIEDEKIIEDGLESFESLKQDVKRVKSDNGKSKEAVEVESIRVQESKKDYEPGESSHSNEDVKSEIRPESGKSKYETRPESGTRKYETRPESGTSKFETRPESGTRKFETGSESGTRKFETTPKSGASKVGYEVRETEETNQDNKSQDNNSQDNKSQDNSQPSTDELPPYDPKNIPYVEVPDYSDVREDSLDKERHQTIDDTDTEAVDPGDGYRIEDSGGKDEAQDERIKPVQEESPYKPVTFDINEYRRPFNLDEFVKQFSRYTRPEDRYKGYTDFGGAWKNPGRFDFSSDFGKYRGRKEYPEDYSKFYSNPKDYSNSEQDSRGYSKDSSKEGTQESPEDYSKGYSKDNSKEGTQKSPEDYSKGYSNPKDYSNSEQDPRDYSKDSAKEGTQESPEDYSKGYSQPKDYSKGYPRVYSKDNMKEGTQDSPSTRFEDEKEFLSRHFTKDVIKRLQDVERPKKKRDQRTDELYKTLSEILEKKDRISRLNDDVDKDGGDGEPRNYKNVWFLQYSSPTGNKEQAMTN